jgi:hypothetical protein
VSLRKLLDCLPRELARFSSAYEIAARAHRSLRPYPTLARLLARLQRTGKRSSEKRKALITRLIRVHQTRPHHLWSTVLLHVFTPMIKKLRKKLVGGDDDTRDGILVEAFQDALLRVPTDDSPRIFMYFRQALRRTTFRALAAVMAWEEVGFGTDADLEPDPSTVYEPPLIGIWLEGHGTRPEQAELLATLVDRGGLRAMVRRRHHDLDAAGQTRAFRRLQQRRRRLVARLRDELRAEAPDTSVPDAAVVETGFAPDKALGTDAADARFTTGRDPKVSHFSFKTSPVSEGKPRPFESKTALVLNETASVLTPNPIDFGSIPALSSEDFCS